MNRRSVNIRQFQPTWLPRWNWLDGGENCLLTVASPASAKGKGEKFYGKVGLLFLLRARTSSAHIALTYAVQRALIPRSFSPEWCCDRARANVPACRGEESFLRLGSLHTLSARSASRHDTTSAFVMNRTAHDWNLHESEKQTSFVWARMVHEKCEARLSEQRYARQGLWVIR